MKPCVLCIKNRIIKERYNYFTMCESPELLHEELPLGLPRVRFPLLDLPLGIPSEEDGLSVPELVGTVPLPLLPLLPLGLPLLPLLELPPTISPLTEEGLIEEGLPEHSSVGVEPIP